MGKIFENILEAQNFSTTLTPRGTWQTLGQGGGGTGQRIARIATHSTHTYSHIYTIKCRYTAYTWR